MPKFCFGITATDTDAGKTFVTCLLARAFRKNYPTAKITAVKPFATGSRSDAEQLTAALSDPTDPSDPTDLSPFFWKKPAAPLVAARSENLPPPDLAAARDWVRARAARSDILLVEGIGGWLVPLTEKETWADFAAALDLPQILVVPNRIGAINAAALSTQAIRASGVPFIGCILNTLRSEQDGSEESNAKILEEIFQIPVLGKIPFGAETLPPEIFDHVVRQASAL
ncbi:MAG: dethiobiotin synthase [Chthoniobacterales bacterium]